MIQASVICLAMVALFEAGGESIIEQKAVIHATVNRTIARQGELTRTNVCKEVWKPHQYKWTAGRKFYDKPAGLDYLTQNKQFLQAYRIVPSSRETWEKMLELAQEEYHDHRNDHKKRDTVNGATYFHSSKSRQLWTRDLVFVKKVDIFKFYADRQEG